MRVLQILPELRLGGVERGTVDLAKFLREKGHHSVVVSAGGPLAEELVSSGVVHYPLPVHRKSPWTIWQSTQALAKIIRNEKIDVLHARSRVPALIAYWASRKTQVPFVTTCHGFYRRHFFSRIMGWGQRVIVASHVIGKRMRDDFGVPYERIRFIPRGVDPKEFQWKRAEKDRAEQRPLRSGQAIIGIIGRLTPIKGHPLFLKAMARVTRVFPNVKIHIIGDAPKPQYKEELLMLVKRLGLTPFVEFLGTRYDIPQALSRLSVLAAPSVGEEAFGRVVIEAGACGTPVVATRIGGFVDILEDEKTGLLVPDDPRLLADAVLRILKDPALANRLAWALRDKVEKEFGLERMCGKTLEVYEEAVTRKKILIIKLSALGDVILSVPSIRALRCHFPDARISVLVGRKSRRLLRNSPYVDDIFVYEDAPRQKRLERFVKLARLLAKENFDIVVDLQNNRTSHLLAFLSGARTRAGHANGKWSFLLNRRTKEAVSLLSPLDHQFQVLRLLGIEVGDKRLELWSDKIEDQKVGGFLESQWVAPSQTLVGLNPGSSARWPTKQWPVENFAKLCDELAKRNIRVVITGSTEDRSLADELLRMTRNKPIDAVGKTSVTELVALVKRCKVFVSSDSAPMHIAASADRPLVALFGPTDPRRHLVPPSRCRVLWKEIPCSPCYLRSCPVGLICMKKITVQEVLDATLSFLDDLSKIPAAQSQEADSRETLSVLF
ncbi:MAG: lipopolysaccharide heptosyltransferase II [Candidatus Omnitrophica bacterium]|nr:lipopolysaccharide heptosyltransferase II [Candidatus Omnitrophota bacterium]